MLPYKDNSRYEVKLNRREATYDDAVRAGHGSAAACGAGADTDDADGAAGEADHTSDAAHVDSDATNADRASGLSPGNCSVLSCIEDVL